MFNKDMLGIAVRKLVTLSGDVLGLVCDLLEKLADPTWVAAAKRFLRKENPWSEGIIQAVPFDPVDFLGKGWTIDEQDEQSLALTEIDLAKVKLKTCLNQGETSIDGEENLKRLKKAKHVKLDARFFLVLWKNQNLIPDAWKEKTNGNNTLIFFDGTILCSPGGLRYSLYLYWNGSQWYWHYYWLGNDRHVSYPSAVLAS